MTDNHQASYPQGVDCAWPAVDKFGNVAVFITAGEGPIPRDAIVGSALPLEAMERMLMELPVTSEWRLSISVPRPDDFIALASRGLFVYDWQDLHRSLSDRTRAYDLIAEPTSPISVGLLPDGLRNLAEKYLVGSGTVFGSSKQLNVAEYVDCIDAS